MFFRILVIAILILCYIRLTDIQYLLEGISRGK
jgi:hypothetical protein